MYTEAEWIEGLKRQREMEEAGLSMGVERFRRKLTQAQESMRGSTVGGARRLLVEAIDPVKEAIQYKIDESNSQRGRKHTALKWIRREEDYPEEGPANLSTEKVGSDVAAFLAARVVLDGIHLGKRDVKQVALDITRYLLDELRYRTLREKAPALFEYRMGKFDTSSYAHRSRSLAAAVRYAEIDVAHLDMPVNARLLVGFWVLDALIQATGLVEKQSETVYNDRGKPETRIFLVPTDETLEWLEARNEHLELLTPVKMPMVVPPLPWRRGDRGGYRFALRGLFPLVRGGSKRAQEIEDMHLPHVYSALNRLQETAWKINRDVLELLDAIERKGGEIAGVPPMENIPEPTIADTLHNLRKEDPETWGSVRLLADETVEAPEELQQAFIREHRHALGKVKNANYHRKLARLWYLNVLRVARAMAPEKAFYFPWNVDFRGRCYPITDYLSPQGSDLEKSLLRFADERPMGEHGGRWLAIHLMNCMDTTPQGQKVSRMTLEERVRWVRENEETILRVAEDPFGGLWWADADEHESLQFYAACCEWARFKASGYSPEFVSGLPCALDGSCNGLQHYAAMFRDEVGARAVNVRANERPQDVYLEIAEAVKDALERRHAEEEDEMALAWLTSGLVDRSLCKRPVMTFGYGSKQYGFARQILEYLEGRSDYEDIVEHFSAVDADTGEVKDRTFAACQYMAARIWEALDAVVVAAFAGMEWLQTCARAVARTGKPVEWTVPVTGFPVVQEYFVSKMRRLETILAGSVIWPSYWEETSAVALYKQANGIAPNVIHSLDAAALVMTVNACADAGIEAFGMVHDSYATVPGDCELMARTLREEFVRLYDRDVAADLLEQFREQAGEEELPEPPAKGSLDLGEVLVSSYFFS